MFLRKAIPTLFIAVLCIIPCASYLRNPFSSWNGVLRDQVGNRVQQVNAVRRMAAAMEIKNPFSSMLLHGAPTLNMGKNKKLRYEDFSWKSCGPSNPLIDIKQLNVTPSPLSFPGDMTLSFDMLFNEDIQPTDIIIADVTIEFKQVTRWVKLPCLGNIGSCTYRDLCALLSGLSCPSDITKQGVRCNCPFQKGEYKLKSYTVEIDAEVFMGGEYRLIANMTSPTKKNVGCYMLDFFIE